MKKKIIIIAIIVLIVLAGAGTAVYFLVIKPRQDASSGNNNTNRNFNFANFSNISGKVLSISATDMIVDGAMAQSQVVWDTNTRITGNSKSDQANVLVVGNTVTVNFTDNTDPKVATKITKIDITAFNQSGTPNQADQPNQNNVNFRRGNWNNGNTGNSGAPRANGPVRQMNRTVVTGTISAIDDKTFTITVSNFGGFNRNGNPPQNDSIDSNQTFSFDPSTTQFFIMQTKSITDIKVQDTLQVTGTLQSDQKTLARNIIIE